MSLNPRPARYAEARVARLNRKSELNRIPPTQFLPCGTSLGEASGPPRERLIVIGQSEHYHPTLGIACFTCHRAHFIRTNPPALRVVQEVVGDIHEASRLPDALSALQNITDGNRPRLVLSGFHNFLSVEDLALHFCFESVLKRLLPNEAGLRGMWLIPSLILLLGVVAAGASHPPAAVLVAFAADANPTATRPATEKSTARAMKKAALKHKTPVGRPIASPPTDKPPELRPWPESAPM